jgi:hypothetical protein
MLPALTAWGNPVSERLRAGWAEPAGAADNRIRDACGAVPGQAMECPESAPEEDQGDLDRDQDDDHRFHQCGPRRRPCELSNRQLDGKRYHAEIV